jgi:hypothetical protein
VPQLKQYRILVNQAVGGKDSELAEFLRARPLAPAEEYPLLLETVDQALLLLANPSASAVKMSR